MQTDMFETETQTRIRDLMRRRQELEANLSNVCADLANHIRNGTSAPISADQSLQLCELPGERYAIYKQTVDQAMAAMGMRRQHIQEFFLVDLDRLYDATRETILRKEAREFARTHAGS